jgi:3-oxoacyl-(acyl-carrier-protein) synthase
VSRRRVVLTGRAIVSPLGVGVDQHWRALTEGRSALAPLARLAALGLPASRGAAVTAELVQPHLGRLPRKQQKLYNRATALAMLAAALAMDDAGVTAGAGDPRRFGVLLGVNALSWDLAAMTQYLVAAESKEQPGTLDMALANSFCMRHINPLDYSLKMLPNLAAGHLAIAHDAQGLCRALTEGPVGGAHAIGQAYHLIEEGDLDVALCGGADAQLEELFFATYLGAGFLASDDGERPGLVAGEGSGILILEAAERARSRGAVVHADVLGFATGAGTGHISAEQEPEEEGRRLTRVIEDAIEEAGDYPDLVALHADGDPRHGKTEAAAVERAAGGRLAGLPRLSMKSAHGDLGAASSPVEFLACSAALQHDMIPPAVSSSSETPSAPLRRALVISLGLFGECAALMLARAGVASEN